MTDMQNPFSLKGKKILITGASSGIGRATAIECSKAGANLVVTGRNKCRLDETLSMLSGDGHIGVVADLSLEIERQQLVSGIDMIDGIVHCAGIANHKLFNYIKDSDVEEIFSINYFAPMLISRDLVKSKKIAKGGSIVFITSTAGIMSSFIGGSLYSSTKGALSGLIKGMALELASKKIRVNGVMPAMIHTPIIDGGSVSDEQLVEDAKRYPLKRYGRPEEVAYGVIYLLSDASAWTTGTNLLIDGGANLL